MKMTIPVGADQHLCAVYNDELLFHLTSELSPWFGTVRLTLNDTNWHSLYEEKQGNKKTLLYKVHVSLSLL